MKIGIYGGTFDPPHLGHMQAAEAAVRALGLDRLMFVPAAVPPHKPVRADTAPPDQRLRMTQMMAEGVSLRLNQPDFAQASEIELARGGTSYTVDTLEQVKRQYPAGELWLLMGSDMFLSLQDWRAPAEIAALVGIAAFARSGADDTALLHHQAETLRKQYGARVEVVHLAAPVEISSTQLRQLLRQERAQAVPFLWEQVYGHILLTGQYGVAADLTQLSDDELRCASLSMVRAKRIAHIKGCEQEAVRLARHWGADAEQARRAAILHDCTKYLNLEEQLNLCEKYGIVLDSVERETVKLLHAKTGSAIARHVFGAPEAVCRAIYWHTTGRAGMHLLDKVLYLADYIEPSRADFDGLDQLRRLAYEDLDAALLLGCELTIQDMEARGAVVHENTLQARGDLKGHTT